MLPKQILQHPHLTSYLQPSLRQMWEFGSPEAPQTNNLSGAGDQDVDRTPFLLRHLTTAEMERSTRSAEQIEADRHGEQAANAQEEVSLDRSLAEHIKNRHVEIVLNHLQQQAITPAAPESYNNLPYRRGDQKELQRLELLEAIRSKRLETARKSAPFVKLGLSSSGYHRKIERSKRPRSQ